MRELAELLGAGSGGIDALRDWTTTADVACDILPPSVDRGNVLRRLQVKTASVIGGLAYETGGIIVDRGWLRLLGSGHPRLPRDLHSWNEGRSSGFFLVADDAAGGFFAVNGGALGPDTESAYYWAPDDLDWCPLKRKFSDVVYSLLHGGMLPFYKGLRWSGWEADVAVLPGDQCYAFYPFLWTEGATVDTVTRATVPTREAFDLKVDIVKQLSGGA